MSVLIRAAALSGFDTLVAELGGDPSDMLSRSGLDPRALYERDALVPVDAVGACLELAARELGRPDLGLLLAGRQDVGILGPLSIGLESAPTVGAALACAERFLFIHSPTVSLRTAPDPRGEAGTVAVRYAPAGPPVGVDLGLGLAHRVLVAVTGRDDYGLRSVHLPDAPAADEAAYLAFFGAPVRFRTREALLRVPAGLLDSPNGGSDALVHRMALEYLESHRRESAATLAGRVSRVVADSLGATAPLIGLVARAFRMHPRTLQRRLAAEGTTYERIVDEARRDAARRLITTTDLPFTQITSMVGLSEQAALTRACRRWFDASPRELRAAGVS